MLGFEAQAGVRTVGYPGFAGQGTVEEIAGVELHAGLGGAHAQGAAGGGLVHRGRQRRSGRLAEHPSCGRSRPGTCPIRSPRAWGWRKIEGCARHRT